jgi:hypothetical protein
MGEQFKQIITDCEIFGIGVCRACVVNGELEIERVKPEEYLKLEEKKDE